MHQQHKQFKAGVMPSSAVGGASLSEESPACVDLLTRAFALAEEGTTDTLDTIRRYSSQVCSILEDASAADRPPLDATDLFHKLAFDVLGALLFRFDMQALDDSDLYNVSVEVSHIVLLPVRCLCDV